MLVCSGHGAEATLSSLLFQVSRFLNAEHALGCLCRRADAEAEGFLRTEAPIMRPNDAAFPLHSPGRRADGSHLPECFKLHLTDSLPTQILLAGKPVPNPAKGKAKGKVQGAAEGKGPEARGKAAEAGRKRSSDEHR